MNKTLRLTPVFLIAALLAGCQGPCSKLEPITAPDVSTGGADFTRFAAVGTSISTGYQSGGVVNRHQVNAYPAIFARQVGKTVQLDGKGTFSQPVVDGNGSPALLQLRSVSPLVISNSGLTAGSPTNTTFPGAYGDMAVPGALLYDYAHNTNYGGSAFLLVTRGLGLIQDQMLSLNPTFVSFEYGANEVLGPATSGSSTAPTGVAPATWNAIASPAAYSGMLALALNGIHTAVPGAKVVVANVPDVSSIPFLTTFSWVTRIAATGALSPLRGWVHRDSVFSTGSGTDSVVVLKLSTLKPGEYVTLGAQSALIANGGFVAGAYNYLTGTVVATDGAPLDSSAVLDLKEQAVLQAKITAMNEAVAAQATQSWVALLDLNALLANLTSNGTTLGATHYTTKFVTGGLFSLDGVHPTDLGHAIIANAMIDAVNAKFGAAIPHVNTASYATASASAAHPAIDGAAAVRDLRIDGLDAAIRNLYRR